jgi:hypothetical protein
VNRWGHAGFLAGRKTCKSGLRIFPAAAIRKFNTPASLPVFTIADLERFATSREYEERVLVTLYDYLLRIDEVRGTGRLFLP